MSDRMLPPISDDNNRELKRHLFHEHGVGEWLTTDEDDLKPGGRLYTYMENRRNQNGRAWVNLGLTPDRFDYLNVNSGYRNDIEDLLHDNENDVHFNSLADLHNAYHNIEWGGAPEQALGSPHVHSNPKMSWKQRYKEAAPLDVIPKQPVGN